MKSLLTISERDLKEIDVCRQENGIVKKTFKPEFCFEDLKKDDSGLIPAVVQDFKSGDVLMLAYMNKDAFEETCRQGVMTYFSRSRKKLWLKGLTSGHFQFVEELKIDCDLDTILARVIQVGAACHTGEKTCFFRDLAREEEG